MQIRRRKGTSVLLPYLHFIELSSEICLTIYSCQGRGSGQSHWFHFGQCKWRTKSTASCCKNCFSFPRTFFFLFFLELKYLTTISCSGCCYVQVCNAVAVASLLNATLVIPRFLYSNVWKDPRYREYLSVMIISSESVVTYLIVPSFMIAVSSVISIKKRLLCTS